MMPIKEILKTQIKHFIAKVLLKIYIFIQIHLVEEVIIMMVLGLLHFLSLYE